LDQLAGIVGVIGGNGAGKTTLFRMIMGQVRHFLHFGSFKCKNGAHFNSQVTENGMHML